MSIQFQEIPANNLVPIFATEFDNSSAAKSGPMPWKNVLIGQATKTDAPSVPTQVFTDAEADSMFGEGSQIALMAKAFRKNAKNMEMYCLALQDSADGSKATGKITITGSATESAPLYLMIGGQSVVVTVLADDTAKTIAESIVAKVTELMNLPVTATSTEGVVTLTAKNKGIAGNDISIELNFNAGENTPSGVTVAITKFTGGSGDTPYNATTVGSKIAGQWYNAIVLGHGDTNVVSSDVTYIKELLDECWTATVQKTGVMYYSVAGTLSVVTTAGGLRNSQVMCIPSIVKSPSLPCVIAAASAGCIAQCALNDPAVPLSNWPVYGVVAPKPEDRLIMSEENTILRSGAALLSAGDDGTVYLKRCVTTYKRNAAGVSDTSYQQLEKIHTLSYLRWDWNAYLGGKYPHAKLADDGNEYGPGQVVMTPSLGKAEILTRYKYWMSKGLVQNYDEFAKNVVVERDPDDDTAMNFLIPANLIDQLLICKSKIQFK
ncbi:MAG: hypothetical protein HUK20_01185 [Fibrobacter sp.]|nr:hypothetical protein [Fibrobacter sp.]